MKKRTIAKAVVTGVIIAELAILDYAAIEFMRSGAEVEFDLSELERAGEQALNDMEGE